MSQEEGIVHCLQKSLDPCFHSVDKSVPAYITAILSPLLQNIVGDFDTEDQRKARLVEANFGNELCKYCLKFVQEKMNDDNEELLLSSFHVSNLASRSVSNKEYEFLGWVVQFLLDEMGAICNLDEGMKLLIDGLKHEGDDENEAEVKVPLHVCQLETSIFNDEELSALFLPKDESVSENADNMEFAQDWKDRMKQRETEIKTAETGIKAKDQEFKNFMSALINLQPLQAIAACKGDVLNRYCDNNLDEEDPDENEACEVRDNVFSTIHDVLEPFPTLKAELDLELEKVLVNVCLPVASLERLISLFSTDIYPRAHLAISNVVKSWSENKKLKTLFGAIFNDAPGIVSLLRLCEFRVVNEDGSQMKLRYIEDDNDDDDDDEESDEDEDDEAKMKKEPLTVLHFAILHDAGEGVIGDLVAMGANVNREASCPEQYQAHNYQYTYLGLAIKEGHSDVFHGLMQHKDELDLDGVSWVYGRAHDYDNHVEYTPLMLAIEENWLSAVEQLLEAGASAEYGEYEQLTPLALILHLAGTEDSQDRYSRHDYAFKVVKLLVSYGANVLNGRAQMEHLELDDEIREFVETEARWAKSKNWLLFLHMAGFRSASPAHTGNGISDSEAVGQVCSTYDLTRLIATFIPY